MKRQACTFPKSRVSFGKLASFFGIPSERRWIRWGLWCAVLVSGAPAAHHSFALDSSTRTARAGYVILHRVTVAAGYDVSWRRSPKKDTQIWAFAHERAGVSWRRRTRRAPDRGRVFHWHVVPRPGSHGSPPPGAAQPRGLPLSLDEGPWRRRESTRRRPEEAKAAPLIKSFKAPAAASRTI